MAINFCKCLTHNFKTGKKQVYAMAQYTKIMSLQEFAKHIAEHNSVFDKATVQGVLIKAAECLREKLLDGCKVQLGDMGDFYIALHSSTTEGTDEFTSANINEVEVRWKPGIELENLLKEAKFKQVETRGKQRLGRKIRDEQIDSQVMAGLNDTDNRTN